MCLCFFFKYLLGRLNAMLARKLSAHEGIGKQSWLVFEVEGGYSVETQKKKILRGRGEGGGGRGGGASIEPIFFVFKKKKLRRKIISAVSCGSYSCYNTVFLEEIQQVRKQNADCIKRAVRRCVRQEQKRVLQPKKPCSLAWLGFDQP